MNSLENNHSLYKESVICKSETYRRLIAKAGTPDLYNTSNSIEICVVTSGCGIHRIQNEDYECRIGDTYLFSTGIPHGYFAKNEIEFPTVLTLTFRPSQIFKGKFSDPYSEEFCYGIFRDKFPFSYALLNSKVLREFEEHALAIEREIKEKALHWESALKARLVILLTTLCRYVNLADTQKRAHSPNLMVTSAAIREIMNSYGDSNLSLDTVASKLYTSPSSLSRVFKQTMGVNFPDYVRGVRLEKCCELLASTDLTNEEIATKCGLKDIPTFYKLFRNYTSMSPYQYRLLNESKKGETVMSIYFDISENLQKGKAKAVKELVERAIAEGCPPSEILNEGLLKGMNIIGEKFKKNEVYVPEVLVAARAMNMGSETLRPYLTEEETKAEGKVCLGTVEGDLHDIGKNLVKMMIEAKGIEVIDLGTDVCAETFVKTAIEQDCKLICCSALLTTTMPVMEKVVKELEKSGYRDKIKIMVGGAPVSEEYAKEIGADAYTSDAASAADMAISLIKGM